MIQATSMSLSTKKPDSPEILVKKFGGTSVGSIERIEALADRLAGDIRGGQLPLVVVSAMSGETNRLIQLGARIDPLYRGPAYDVLVSSGEQVSIALLCIALEKRGIAARPYLAFQLGIYTDSIYSKARIKEIRTDNLEKCLGEGIVPVVAGFQGIDDEQNITTLGRGGSDTTAVALAAALKLPACEIYTDVPAVFSADPRIVKKAREIERLSFEEMMEMASLGSKILHIRSVEIAAKYGIRIHVRSSFENREGTWIRPEGECMENPLVSAVTHEAQTAILKLYPIPPGTEFLAGLFEQLSSRGVVVDIITQSIGEKGQRLAFSVTNEDLPLAKKVIAETLPQGIGLEVLEGRAKISVVGVGMRNHPGVAARFFQVLAEKDVPVHLVTTSEIKISAVIDGEHLNTAAEALHGAFDLNQESDIG